MTDERPGPELVATLEDLRARLAEAEEALQAIRSGEVDGVMVAGVHGEQVYTLRGADRIYRQLIETMSEGAVTISTDGVILFCNSRLAQMLGRQPDEVLGTVFRDYLPPADQKVLDAVLGQADTVPARLELHLRDRKGSLVPVYLSASSLLSAGSEVVFCIVLTDLTELRDHEKTVEAERLSRLILEQAAEAIVVCDALGQVIRASGTAQALCDGNPLWRPFSEVFPLWTDASELFNVASVLKGETQRNVDVALARRGQTHALLLNATPLQRDQQNLGCVVTLTDITARKQSGEALRASRLLLEGILNAIPVRVFWKDTNLKFLGCNAAFARDAGLSDPRELIGKDDFQMVWRDQAEQYREDDREVLQSGHPKLHLEELQTTPTGDTITLLTSKLPLLGPAGETTGILGTYLDISELKRAEADRDAIAEQLRTSQKLEAIGSLAGGVAHDFNNLLTVILSYNELALEALLEDDPIKDDLQQVKQAGERAAALTRQLLAFSRKQVLQPLRLSLNEVTAGVEKMLRRILGEDIELIQALAPDLGLTLADPGQIEQVLMNLVVNARDSMPEGGILTIQTANTELDTEIAARHETLAPGPYIMLAVTDSGCGMDAQTRARIFEPFFTTKERDKGTGLGLSTVHGIINQSGGNIWVYSEPGHGTTFKVYLPRLLGATEASAPTLPAVRGRSTGTETILVIEDEEALRKLSKRTLEAAGHTVLTAANGEEALKKSAAFQGEIHLVLTDVVMPRMGGRVTAQALSDTRPHLKVIYMSGYTDDAIVHHGVCDLGTHFLAKPFSGQDLTHMVRRVLDEPHPS